MSTSDSNYDEFNSVNEFDDANADAGLPADADMANAEIADESTGDAGEYVDAGDYTESTDYADSSEYSDADSSEYSEDAYAPLEGVDEYSTADYTSDEPVEEERQEVYFPPVMNRYNVILLISLLLLTTGVILLLIRLADYKFNVKAKQTDSGFASVERVVPMLNAADSVIKNV